MAWNMNVSVQEGEGGKHIQHSAFRGRGNDNKLTNSLAHSLHCSFSAAFLEKKLHSLYSLDVCTLSSCSVGYVRVEKSKYMTMNSEWFP